MKSSGSHQVIRALKDENIGLVFGIPGTHNIELYDALVDEPHIKAVLVTDEQSASFMADGVARSSGTMAALSIVPGAGLTHALSGIAECFLDGIPLLVLGCGIRNDTGASFQLHDVDQQAIAKPVCKQIFTITSAQSIYRTIRSACTIAKTSPAGPVFVEVPANYLMIPSEINESDVSVSAPGAQQLQLDMRSVTEAAKALSNSKSIGIYAGLGTLTATDELIRLAERLDAIVFTTISGKGVFPEDHPRWAWSTMGNAAPPEIRKIEAQLDCLLAIGCRFSEVATASYGFSPPANLIHIDIDSQVFSRNYKASHTIEADSKVAILALLECNDLKVCPPKQQRLDALRVAHQKTRSVQKSACSGKERVSPYQLIESIQRRFGPDTVYTTDSGNGTFLAMELLRLKRPRSFMAPVDFSCMGYSIPAAIGAKLAQPERPVVALVGDGAFLMTGLELLTAATYGCNVVAFILNDGELSQIAQFQRASVVRTTCTDLGSLDYKSLAAALKLEYQLIRNDSEIEESLDRISSMNKEGAPVLVEVAFDSSVATFFSKGVVKTNFLRLAWKDRIRMVSRVIKRKIT